MTRSGSVLNQVAAQTRRPPGLDTERANSDRSSLVVLEGWLPAIAVTAYATIPDRGEALAVGFQQHLPKPIDPARLVQAVYDLIGRPD